MGDDEDQVPGRGHLLDQGGDLIHAGQIEPAGGFVEGENLFAGRDAGGHREPLLLAP